MVGSRWSVWFVYNVLNSVVWLRLVVIVDIIVNDVLGVNVSLLSIFCM